MKKELLKDLCKKDEIGKYGIPAAAEEFDVTKTRYLRISDISDDGMLLDADKKSVSAADIDKYVLNDGDIVFARTGNSTGRTYFHEKKYGKLAFAGFLIKYALDPKKVLPKYLKFYTISNEYKNWVKNLSGGSTRGNINAQTFADCPVSLPSPSQQKLLVDVLSSITDKIELNRRINAELEALAKTLYDYWFVQFDFPDAQGKPYKSSGGKMVWSKELRRDVPEGWEVKRLEQMGNFKNGINYDPNAGGDTLAKIINVRDVSKSSIFISKNGLDEIDLNGEMVRKYLVSANDILIARSGIPGAVRMITDYDENTIYCGFIICFKPKSSQNLNHIFFTLRDLEKSSTSKSAGTIMQNISQETLRRMMVLEPEKRILASFNEFISPIFEQINNTSKETRHLTALRDWLLPLLMNGQVRVG